MLGIATTNRLNVAANICMSRVLVTAKGLRLIGAANIKEQPRGRSHKMYLSVRADGSAPLQDKAGVGHCHHAQVHRARRY